MCLPYHSLRALYNNIIGLFVCGTLSLLFRLCTKKSIVYEYKYLPVPLQI